MLQSGAKYAKSHPASGPDYSRDGEAGSDSGERVGMGARGDLGKVLTPEGFGREWGRPKGGNPASPRCVVKVDFLGLKGGKLRGDLQAVEFCDYVVGSGSGGRPVTGSGAPVSKGRDGAPVAMFACDDEQDTDFALRWLKRDPELGGQDARKWTTAEAWCVNLMRRYLEAGRYRRSPMEQRHYRIRFCPDVETGQALAAAGRLEEAARRFMAAVEQDFGGQLWWIGACHYHGAKVLHPHAHLAARGISRSGDHVYFPQKYLRPSAAKLKADPAASSPIEWRARAVLAEMMREMGGKRAAG